jgi:ABC-type amino acid transport system permease subunit
MGSTMLEIVAFGIAGFLVGFCIFSMLWTLPRKGSPYGREIVRNPLFWYSAIFAGLAMAVVFGAVSRVL